MPAGTRKSASGARTRAPRLAFSVARPDDAPEIAALLNAAADDLTARYGHGPWSNHTSERGVLFTMRRRGQVWVARRGRTIAATWTLGTRKPWAIDRSYFSPASASPLYLTDMAVSPSLQRQGVGRRCLEAAIAAARERGADAIRLDSYADRNAGAGEFYARCGFTEVGQVVYKGTPLRYFELLIDR